MLVVFLILVLLVLVMKLLSAIVFRYFPDPEVPAGAQLQPRGNPEIAAAIAAAYAQKK